MAWAEEGFGAKDGAKGRRRSRLEIVCEVLRVISNGVEKPTRIMQISNITWNDLLSYIEILAQNRLIVIEAHGAQVEYRLTERGERVVDLYMGLKEIMASVSLDDNHPRRVANVPEIEDTRVEGYLSLLSDRLRDEGYLVDRHILKGRSGEDHRFDVVAEGQDGSKVGYFVREEVSKEEIVGMFVSQLDTGARISVVCMVEPSEETRKMADNFSITIRLVKAEEWVVAGRRAPADRLGR